MRVPVAERGYAMVAVVAGIGIMAAIAAGLAQFTATRLGTLEAEDERARLSAAADAGVGIALGNLTKSSLGARWAIDGRVYHASFGGIPLDMRIEDERGKIMLDQMDEENFGWLLDAMGITGEQAAVLKDSFGDWIDQDDEARPNGAESEYYGERNLAARNGAPLSVEELAEVRGFTPALVARIARIATVGIPGGFDKRYAAPLAIQVMLDGRADSPEVLERQKELAGQVVALPLDEPDAWKNRAVTIQVIARGRGNAVARREALVVLTGSPRRPYDIRWAR